MADPTPTPTPTRPLTRAGVQAARDLIAPYIHTTPILTNATLSRLASTPQPPSSTGVPRPARPTLRLWFKCENLQRIGAFKVRGAFHAIEQLKRSPAEWAATQSRGVVTHSSGNHAQALALAAQTSGIPAHIVMPSISAAPKIAATRGYGASVVFSGSTSTEREAAVAELVAATGARLIPPYDHPDIILGQGTMGLEMLEQVAGLIAAADAADTTDGDEPSGVNEQDRPPPRTLDAIITPCGGGGMLSGVALSCEGTSTRVFGAEPSFEDADDGKRGYYSGRRIETVKSLTIADGLRTPVGAIPWSIIYERRLVAGMYSVSEDEIKAALRLVYERMKLVVEPSAVVGLAVALYNEDFRAMVEREAGDAGWDLGLVFSGGNVSLEALGNLFAEP
ncbi:pyridoxal-phosphate dependent enzyme-domain-containing protein [Podospora appendiculata]|uniref:Pyridoxal-phosphate dependent enzyme-domain-containing protein n=1 Tax=Podospora appendiculata TaxID=314037 RepID=A0AAE0X5H4_9PEZI|nr:pyridoxal-phosphate dependent enzyme-domain-containing protein [Podospora appendiculata]